MAKTKDNNRLKFSLADKVKRGYQSTFNASTAKGDAKSNDFYQAMILKDQELMKSLFASGRKIESLASGVSDLDFKETDIYGLLFIAKNNAFYDLLPLLNKEPFKTPLQRQDWFDRHGPGIFTALNQMKPSQVEEKVQQVFSRLLFIFYQYGVEPYGYVHRVPNRCQELSANIVHQAILLWNEKTEDEKKDWNQLDRLGHYFASCKKMLNYDFDDHFIETMQQYYSYSKNHEKDRSVLSVVIGNEFIGEMNPCLSLLNHHEALVLYLTSVESARELILNKQNHSDTLLIHACRGFAKKEVQKDVIYFLTDEMLPHQITSSVKGETALHALVGELWAQREKMEAGTLKISSAECLEIIDRLSSRGLKIYEATDIAHSPLSVLWECFSASESKSQIEKLFGEIIATLMVDLNKNLAIEERMKPGVGGLLTKINQFKSVLPPAINLAPHLALEQHPTDDSGQQSHGAAYQAILAPFPFYTFKPASNLKEGQPRSEPSTEADHLTAQAKTHALERVESLVSGEHGEPSRGLERLQSDSSETIREYEDLLQQMQSHTEKMQEMVVIGQKIMQQIHQKQEKLNAKNAVHHESIPKEFLAQEKLIKVFEQRALSKQDDLLETPAPRPNGARRILNSSS